MPVVSSKSIMLSLSNSVYNTTQISAAIMRRRVNGLAAVPGLMNYMKGFEKISRYTSLILA